FDYLWHKKGVGPQDLGVRPYHADKIKNRRQRVSDNLLRRMMEMLTSEGMRSSSKGLTRDAASRYWKYLNEMLAHMGFTLTLSRLEDLRDKLLEE
ncbi:MAG: hypothetical protein QW290_10080, partial [Sulfolobales archaeon]